MWSTASQPCAGASNEAASSRSASTSSSRSAPGICASAASFSALARERTVPRTSCPAASSSAMAWLATKPVAPVTSTRVIIPPFIYHLVYILLSIWERMMAQATNPRGRRKLETRARLMAAAARLYLARGIDGVSLDEVARAAGRTKGAVYGHFADKQTLLIEMWRAHYAQKQALIADALSRSRDAQAMQRELRRAM